MTARAGLDDFVRDWANALHPTRYVGMTPNERHEFVFGLATRLDSALRAEPFDPTAGYRVGEALVAGEYAAPESLGATVTVINARLLDDLARDGALPGDGEHGGPTARLARLVEALTTGFARAMHNRTLDAQDEIRFAALAARGQAERELRESEARQRHASLHDALTGLPNRTMFTEQLAEACTFGDMGIAVCCLDLDGFGRVNDSLGYRVGDRLLTAVADRLSGLAAELDHLLARLESDRFAILVERTTCLEDATKVADRALSTIAEPISIDGYDLAISASAGVAEVSGGEAHAADVVRAAETALHWAKDDGKARWAVFEAERCARDIERYRLSAAMPRALSRGEFRLEYQPLVALADSSLAGFEALARWHHPERGLLGADRFIELAEDTGLIVQLGLRLLEQACREAVAWRASGIGRHCVCGGPVVSVNVAVQQLRHDALVANVREVLDRTGLPAQALQLEITESAVIDTHTETIATLRALADLGVRLALDDFGTGYANLAILPALPLHCLKLAAPFVTGTAEYNDAFLRAVIELGHTLGLTVTAEGLETQAEADRLRAIGCDTGQGWYFGRPMPPDQLARVYL